MAAASLSWLRGTWTTIWKPILLKSHLDAPLKAATRHIPGSWGLTYISRHIRVRRSMCVQNRNVAALFMKKEISRLIWGFILERNLTTATSRGVWSLFRPRVIWTTTLKNIKKARYVVRHPLLLQMHPFLSKTVMLKRQVILPLIFKNSRRLMNLSKKF